MNHSSTVCQRNIIRAGYIKRLLILLFAGFHREIKQRLIFLILQILSHIGFQDLISRDSLLLIAQLSKNGV